MNSQIKEVCKKAVYYWMERLDVLAPQFAQACVRYFFRLRAINDLHIHENVCYTSRGPYVTLHNKKPKYYKQFLKTYQFDSDGIPVYLYEGETSYAIVQISQFGLMEYGYYLDNHCIEHLNRFLLIANKVVKLQDTHGGWPYQFDHPCPHVGSTLKSGWYSAMGQGQAISLLARAFVCDPKEEYRIAAHQALELLEIPVTQGGLLAQLGGLHFYEEYPTDIPSFTLNGLIFCMIGLYDGYKIFEDETAKCMFYKMKHTILQVLPLYDDETISSYDLCYLTYTPSKKLRNRKYHILHIQLLQALNSIEPNQLFEFYINKWRRK